MGKDGKRTCGIEANAFDRVRVDVVLGDCTLDRIADASPDIGRRLFLILLACVCGILARTTYIITCLRLP